MICDFIDDQNKEVLNKSNKILDNSLFDNKIKFKEEQENDLKNNLEKFSLTYSNEAGNKMKLEFNFIDYGEKMDLDE